MNPFDFPGPQFLVFYALLGAGVLFGLRLWRRQSEPAPPATGTKLTDPYTIAYLRGGAREAVSVATVSLIDRKLLRVVGKDLVAVDPTDRDRTRRPLERALLARSATQERAASIFEDDRVVLACNELHENLSRDGLIPDARIRARRRILALVAIALMVSVALYKITLALERGRSNVGFLVLLAIVAVIAIAAISLARRTPRGNAVMGDLRDLFGALKDRRLQPGGATSEAALLAAIFGVAALPTYGELGEARRITKREGSSSCGSGSACGGGGGGDGGGGCGGCGSS